MIETNDTQAAWDERYADSAQVWSGNPNAALVHEVGDLTPGRALDVGCGEGADSVWLATRGWSVTGLELSEVALQRAVELAGQSGAQITWVHAPLLEAALPAGGFDLVSVHYPALRCSDDHAVEHCLIDLVAPGGLLLVVCHAHIDVEHARARGFDPTDYVNAADVAAVIGTDWQVAMDESRPRHVHTGAGAGHSNDVVLTARRPVDVNRPGRSTANGR